ncbi:hypothetical protein BDW22DRAFT_1352311 [Trametopsis cervina]|nr:hypothetical protein BDW22DRAFT_1352311 [Trametopsis cervina]
MYPSLASAALEIYPSTSMSRRHVRSPPITDFDSVFAVAQHEHTLRARNISRSPSASTSSSSSSSSRPLRRLPEPPKRALRRLPEPPMASPRSFSSFASTSSAGKSSSIGGNPDDKDSSYLTFDESDSDTDYDELDDLSDPNWSFIQCRGVSFPVPPPSPSPPVTPNKPARGKSFLSFRRSPAPTPIALAPATQQIPRRQPSSPSQLHPNYHIMKELGAKELEPIAQLMEPGIFADDGSQGDWRQMVDDLFIRGTITPQGY